MTWKKVISSFLICTLLTGSFMPELQANASELLVGENGTVYDADYDPFIADEDGEYYDEEDEEYQDYVRDYGVILASGSDWELASGSNWELASDSNWTLATGSNADLNIVDYTTPGPLLPAVGGMRRMMRTMAFHDADEPSGIHTEKYVTYDEAHESYKITLESFVEGTINTTTVTTPVDVVLVLDVSGSMDECIECGGNGCYELTEAGTAGSIKKPTGWFPPEYFLEDGTKVDYCDGYHPGLLGIGSYSHTAGWYRGDVNTHRGDNGKISHDEKLYTKTKVSCGETRISALKNAVNTFIETVQENAKKNNKVEHRIAIVKFASETLDTVGNDRDRNGYNYSQVVVGLSDVNEESNVNILKNAVNSFEPGGATYADYGMEHAADIINSVTRESQKAVIMFTDGQPGYSSFESQRATDTIEESKIIKDKGATVYTIGVFGGADPTADFSGDSDDEKTNRYMHYVSSNYKYATGLNNGGTATKPDTGSYYLSASSAESLEEIFQSIGEEIQGGGASINLGTETIMKDIVTDSFEIPGGANAINVYTADCTGKEGNEFVFADDKNRQELDVTVKDNTVSVKGFDYSKNFVSDKGRVEGNVGQAGEFYGRKLIVEFTVKPKAGFLGGNGVPTNGESSGIYGEDNGTNIVKHFDVPYVNVPIKEITVTPQDKNVYLAGSVTQDQLTAGATATVGGKQGAVLDFSKEKYGLQEWQYRYVDITPSVPSVDELKNLEDDTTYTLTVSVSPKEEGGNYPGTPAIEKKGTGTAKINVFKPTVYFKDGRAYYGDKAPSSNILADNYEKTEWKHVVEDNVTMSGDQGVTMIGDEPVLSFTCDYTDTAKDEEMVKDGKINTKKDIPVNVKEVHVNGSQPNYVKHTTVMREKCNNSEVDLEGKSHFVLHIDTCNLTIKKEGGAPEETYVFSVYKDNELYTRVPVKGSESITLKELPVGTYRIEEDESWAWRYESSYSSNPVTLVGSVDGCSGEITCTNEKKNDKWLNVYAVVENVFGEAKTASDSAKQDGTKRVERKVK